MKSFFSKIGTLLLCGVAVAMVGCNDLQEDINKAQNDISAVTVTVEDLQKAIAALEAEQDKMAEDYAKKADVEAAKTALESQLATEKAALNSAIATINQTLAQTATKQELNALQTSLNALSTELQTKAENLTKALEGKADKAQVEASFASLAAQYKALTTALEGKADKAQLELVKGDVTKLIEGYQEIVQSIQNLSTQVQVMSEKLEDNTTAISTLKTDVESLKTFAMEVTYYIQNLNGQLTSLTERVEVLEETLAEKAEKLEDAIEDLEELASKLEDVEEANELQDEAIEALKGADKLLEEKLTAFELAYNNQVAEFKSQIKALQDHKDDYIAADDSLKAEFNNKIEALQTTLSNYETKFNSAIAELEQLVSNKVDKAIFDATLENLYDELAKVAAFKADIDKLLARIQSLVYVPEYSDGKADINYVIVDTSALASTVAVADQLVVPALSTLKFKVNAEDAASIAESLVAANFEFEVKTVKTRANEEAVPALTIKKVTAEGGYLLFDVVAKDFHKDFFLTNTKKNMYSVSLKLADGNNNLATEFVNLHSVKVNEITPAIEPASELHEIPYDKADTTVVILKGNKLVFKDANGAKVSAEELAKYELSIDRVLKTVRGNSTIVYGTEAEGNTYAEAFGEGIRRVYDVTYDKEINDYVVRMGDKFTRADKGRVFPFQIVYTVNGFDIAANSDIELTPKQVSYDVPAVVVPWSVAVADELRDATTGELYANDIFRDSIQFSVPENFEGYTLRDIMKYGTEIRRSITLNGEVATGVGFAATVKPDFVQQRISGYAFPEHNATNEYNEYVLTVVTEREAVRATITFTFKLGKKPAPVVINMPAAKLGLIGAYPYYIGEVDYAGKAYEEFLKFAGYATEADAEAAFEAAFADAAAVADAPENTVTVNGETGTYNHVDYINGYIRFYNLNKVVEGPQKYVSTINNFWFGVPFTFNVDATLNVPTHSLVYSMGDYVVDVDNVKTVYVDAKVDAQTGVYTVNKSDLGKYFAVSKYAENTNNLTVSFEVKTTGAPNPAASTVAVSVDPNEDVENLVLAKNQAVIEDWTNNKTFEGNKIEVEAVLTVNGAFELDRKPVTLYVQDPLAFSVNNHTEARYTGKDAVVNTKRLVSVKELFNEKKELVKANVATVAEMFTDSDAGTKYGAELEANLTRVYYVVGDKTVAYETSKYSFAEGVITLHADDAVLQTSIFAEIEYTLTHRLSEKSAEESTKTVVVEFKPAN